MKDNVEDLSTFLRLLGHPIRLQVALILYLKPHTVSELEEKLGVRQPNLSQHLAVLREAGLLTSAREAKSVTYSLSRGMPEQLISALNNLDNRTEDCFVVTEVSSESTTNNNGNTVQVASQSKNAQSLGDELVFAQVRFPQERD